MRKDKLIKTQKAGGIILKEYNNTKQILLIYRKAHGDWTFPKGHCEEGETPERTVVREINEETGLNVEIVKKLPALEYIGRHLGNPVCINMFLLKPLTMQLKTESSGDELKWITIDNVVNRLSHQVQKNYFIEIKNLI